MQARSSASKRLHSGLQTSTLKEQQERGLETEDWDCYNNYSAVLDFT